MKKLLLIFVVYGGNTNGSFGNIEVASSVYPPTLQLIKEVEMKLKELLNCNQVVVVNWKELSDEQENVEGEVKD